LPGGFALARSGRNTVHFGPCVARDRGTAHDLAAWCASHHASEAVSWDILATNPDAAPLARELGFEPARRLMRMVRPGRRGAAEFASDDRRVYAAAGFEYG